MPLTEDQKKAINIQTEIDRLSKQQGALESSIKTMAAQTEEWYAKRQQAGKEYEDLKLDSEKLLKSIQAQREEIEQKKRDLVAEEKKVLTLREKLNEDKAIFSAERGAFRDRTKELEEKEASFLERAKELEAEEKKLTARKDDQFAAEKMLSEKLRNADSVKETSSINQNTLQSEITKAKQAQEEAEKAKADYEKRKNLTNGKLAEFQKVLDVEKAAFLKEKSSAEEGLRKRELEIVRREKQIENSEAIVKSKLEEIELQASKKKAPKK